MAGEQSIQLINALAFAKGTQEPTNRDVLWIDDNIEGSIYTKLKLFNTSSGSWEIISRSNIQLLNDLKTVDGAGSGLDADTLQGYTPAQLMSSGGGGGSVPDLFTGQLLVGQGDTIGTAQTVGGIATIDTSGNLIYIPGTISHADLADIGTFTHAQIDSHINDTANPHGVTASQVGNTTAQWNANSIEGNLTNLGTLGSSEDGYAVVWDDATSRFITAPSGGDTIFTGGTFTGDSLLDLDGNNLTFSNGSFVIQGAGTGIGTTLALYDNDTTPNKTWEFLDNGDVVLGSLKAFTEISYTGVSHPYLKNTAGGGAFWIAELSNDREGAFAVAVGGSYSKFASYGSNGAVNPDRRDKTILEGAHNHGELVILNNASSNNAEIWLSISNNTQGDATEAKRKVLVTNNDVSIHNADFIVNPSNTGTPTKIGSEEISLQGQTAIQGVGTSTGTNLVLYDNDTTPNKTWEWLDSGDVNIGQNSTVDLGGSLTFDTNSNELVFLGNLNAPLASFKSSYFEIGGRSGGDFFRVKTTDTADNSTITKSWFFDTVQFANEVVTKKPTNRGSWEINVLRGGSFWKGLEIDGNDGGAIVRNIGNNSTIFNILDNNDATDYMKITTNGNMVFSDITSFEIGSSVVNMPNLPTSSTGLSSGDLWNDGGTLKIA